MQTAREESSIFIFGETLLKRESAAAYTVCRESAEAINEQPRWEGLNHSVGNHSNLRTYSSRAKKY